MTVRPWCHSTLQIAGLDTSSALGAFERMEEKVMSLEAQAEAAQMVSESCLLPWNVLFCVDTNGGMGSMGEKAVSLEAQAEAAQMVSISALF